MPFGLKRAAQTFMADGLFLQDFGPVFVYLDAIFIASSSKKEHIDDLNAVFRRLQEHGLVIRLKKCIFRGSFFFFFRIHWAAGFKEMCAFTAANNRNWWFVDLLATYQIHRIQMLNTRDVADGLRNITVDIFDQDPTSLSGFPDSLGQICSRTTQNVSLSQWLRLDCQPGFREGRFVRVIKWGYQFLTLCEVRPRTRQ